ncbi:MAG: rSAM-associated Gly-rich repeat protein [Cyanobacteria bacterium]|nr:rSAM-associated Gly-rich repeat protein [Cyanobacteriota bacterium]
MAFFSRSRLFGLLLIVAALPMDLGSAMATGLVDQATSLGDGAAGAAAQSAGGEAPLLGTVESRLQRIALAVQQRQRAGEASSLSVADDALAVIFVNGRGLGWSNGGFQNGGFYNGGFQNGGFQNGGFYNGGFQNGGFYNGGFRNGGLGNRW